MAEITDEFMQSMLGKSREYAVVFLTEGPNYATAERDVIWEHGRRNFSLRADGVMNIVGPLVSGETYHGLCIINGTADEAAAVMDGDPAVIAGIFGYEVRTMRTFPGDTLGD